MYGEFYLCTKCDRVYEEEEVEVLTEREYRGECHGVPAYEEMDRICCPHCGGDCELIEPDEMARYINQLVSQNSRLRKNIEAVLQENGLPFSQIRKYRELTEGRKEREYVFKVV